MRPRAHPPSEPDPTSDRDPDPVADPYQYPDPVADPDGAAGAPAAGTRRGAARATRPWWRRPLLLGFAAGFLAVVPGVLFALLSPVGERVLPFLTPGAELLRPLRGVMASWPGGVNLLLAAVLNGLVLGLVAVGIAAVLRRVRRRRPG